MKKNVINKNLASSSAPPVGKMRLLLDKVRENKEHNLLDLSQAVPNNPPPKSMLRALQNGILDSKNHRYGDILGRVELREKVTNVWNIMYKSDIRVGDVGITSGCNQAFCAAISSIARPGDSIILPTPWYFNHKMWLDMQGIKIIPLPCKATMLPDYDMLRRVFEKSVKAVVLVSPNNPTGLEYSKNMFEQFADFVREKNITLIIDETYRDFATKADNLHSLLQRNDWREWLIHLYSFSKAYRIPGHRVGAIVTAKYRLKHIEKFLDTVTICPNQLGQEAAIHGLNHLSKFIETQRKLFLKRKNFFRKAMKDLPNWKILSIGAYFAYIKYPLPLSPIKFSELLLREKSVLVMPGSLFEDEKDDLGNYNQHIRLAFANVDQNSLTDLVHRLKAFEGLFYEKYCFQQKTSLKSS